MQPNHKIKSNDTKSMKQYKMQLNKCMTCSRKLNVYKLLKLENFVI